MNDFKLSNHFNLREFQCPCCFRVKLLPQLVEALEALRSAIGGKPIIVTSGYRCQEHNKMIGGAINSDHLYGWAADIVIDGVPSDVIANEAEKMPHLVKRVGTYADRDCVHIGVVEREGLPARWGKSND